MFSKAIPDHVDGTPSVVERGQAEISPVGKGLILKESQGLTTVTACGEVMADR